MSGPLFPLGHVVATPAALNALQSAGDDVTAYLIKHLTLDPGDLCKEDVDENKLSLREGFRILSAFTTSDGKAELYVITEADRSSTAIILRSEY